jgi:hypothetical protein
VRELEDDMVFTRRKRTLADSFSVGLDDLQRGFLGKASLACQTARFELRLHGQVYHRLFNELLLISIRRAHAHTDNQKEFMFLETELADKVIPLLEPKGVVRNPKLYLYGLRELAVVQYARGQFAEMRATLRKMEKVSPGPQWKSRINLLYSRASYKAWQLAKVDLKKRRPDALLDALSYSDWAFKHATGGKESIGGHTDRKSLVKYVEGMGSRNLIDTVESLVTYGTVQVFLIEYLGAVAQAAKRDGAFDEAIKSGSAVIELSGQDNPRLQAMGHLILTDAYRAYHLMVEASRHLELAKILEARIEHKYVEDRRKFIEAKIQMSFILHSNDFESVNDAMAVLFEWLIKGCTDRSSIPHIADQLGVGKARVKRYIKMRGPSSSFYNLLPPSERRRKS